MKSLRVISGQVSMERTDVCCDECGAEGITYWIELTGWGAAWVCEKCAGEVIVGKKDHQPPNQRRES